MRARDVDSVLIVGGGIVGLVCARALALRGISVTLVERKPTISDDGGIGLGLQCNAMTAIGEIGLARACVDDGVPVAVLRTYAPDGRLLAEQPTQRWCESPWPGFTGISRARFHRILVDGAREAGVALEAGAEIAGVEQHGARVEAALADGRRLQADLVVGADGIYSRIRGLLFPEHAQPRATGEAVWRGLLPGVQRDDVGFVFGAGVGTIGYTPLVGETYLYVVDRDDRAPPRDATDMAERMAALVRDVPGFPSELAPRLSQRPGDVHYRRLETILLPRPWYRGRIVLMGDAAHAGPPTLAQGAAMGIEDGVVLATCLAEGANVETALERFMQRRFDRVRTILDASLTVSRAQMEPGGQAQILAAHRAAAQALSRPY